MKISFTCNKLNNGGAERVICNIANRMVDDGHKVRIICLEVLPSFYYEINKNIQVIELDKKISSRNSWLNRKVAGIRNFIRLRNAISGSEIVISFYTRQNCYSILAARFHNIPIICAERDHFFLTDGRINHWLRKTFYPHANGFIHQTDMARAYLRKTTGLRCRDIILPNPLWLTNFPVRNPKLGFVCAVGRIADQKNYDGMIDAFNIVHKRIPYATLHIYGEGSGKQVLEDKIQTMGLTGIVVMEGLTKDVAQVYADSEIFVMFSHGEGYPNALMEALASGVPSVSSDCAVGGPKDMIQDGYNGFLVECDDVQGLADKIIDLLQSKKLQKNFSENAIGIRETNDFSNIYCEFMTYIEEVISHTKKTNN